MKKLKKHPHFSNGDLEPVKHIVFNNKSSPPSRGSRFQHLTQGKPPLRNQVPSNIHYRLDQSHNNNDLDLILNSHDSPPAKIKKLSPLKLD